jgi:starvation-inducible DNA-binding protein
LNKLLKVEGDLFNKSRDADDEGTNSMVSGFITKQEKRYG